MLRFFERNDLLSKLKQCEGINCIQVTFKSILVSVRKNEIEEIISITKINEESCNIELSRALVKMAGEEVYFKQPEPISVDNKLEALPFNGVNLNDLKNIIGIVKKCEDKMLNQCRKEKEVKHPYLDQVSTDVIWTRADNSFTNITY